MPYIQIPPPSFSIIFWRKNREKLRREKRREERRERNQFIPIIAIIFW
jgi:hypothetical protein